MTSNSTLTIQVSPEVEARLEQLAQDTHRSKAVLAAEVLSAYVDHEFEIIEGIREGLADVEADRTVSHEEAMAEIDAAIEAAQRHRH